jgi:hypothetical protein
MTTCLEEFVDGIRGNFGVTTSDIIAHFDMLLPANPNIFQFQPASTSDSPDPTTELTAAYIPVLDGRNSGWYQDGHRGGHNNNATLSIGCVTYRCTITYGQYARGKWAKIH